MVQQRFALAMKTSGLATALLPLTQQSSQDIHAHQSILAVRNTSVGHCVHLQGLLPFVPDCVTLRTVPPTHHDHLISSTDQHQCVLPTAQLHSQPLAQPAGAHAPSRTMAAATAKVNILCCQRPAVHPSCSTKLVTCQPGNDIFWFV